MLLEKEDNDVLVTGHYLALKFAEGWWFTQVLETEFVELKPWILLNENENRAEIAANTAGSEDDEVKDTLERRYLYPDEQEKNLIYQVQFGIAPSRMQIYPIYGRNRGPNLEGESEPGEPAVPFTGFDSPYNNPSVETQEFVINGQSFPSFQAYNPMDEAREARISFHVNRMKYATLTDKNVMLAILQGQQPATKYPMGRGAQRNDQLSVPSWLSDRFGDHIYTTEEILDANDNQNTRNVQISGGGS